MLWERYVSGREVEVIMVFFLLEIKVEFENIINLVFKGGFDGMEYIYYFKVIYLDFENVIFFVLEV